MIITQNVVTKIIIHAILGSNCHNLFSNYGTHENRNLVTTHIDDSRRLNTSICLSFIFIGLSFDYIIIVPKSTSSTQRTPSLNV